MPRSKELSESLSARGLSNSPALQLGRMPHSDAERHLANLSGLGGDSADCTQLLWDLRETKSDWEVELGVVIGKVAEHVSEAEALSCIAGYCVANDVSEREWQQERGGTWCKGKGAPGFGPLGPWLVTADEVPDPQALPIWLKLNGETVQASTTADMIFSVAEIVSYLSRFVRLVPGDVIVTGTPSGVGLGMKPPRYLKAGDVVELGIEGLGSQRQDVVAD